MQEAVQLLQMPFLCESPAPTRARPRGDADDDGHDGAVAGTSMARGLLDAEHALDATSARTFVLSQCDVALVVGARLNWLLHFGDPPRWGARCAIILVDIDAGEIALRAAERAPGARRAGSRCTPRESARARAQWELGR
eukprot:scaffold1645_cov252-Prasinococcus_capsulatus_cf.AAC.4